MNQMNRGGLRTSLLERAADRWDLRPGTWPVEPAPVAEVPSVPAVDADELVLDRPTAAPVARGDRAAVVDRALLVEAGMLVPDGPVTALAEEFRLVKRQLVATARRIEAADPAAARTVLVCSARPDDGKTFCAINLALSLAAERDVRILLVDADFAKPDVMRRLGLEDGPGLLDALSDEAMDVEALVLATDVPQLSVLPAGKRTNADTELLSSAHAARVLERLVAADAQRIVIFDSPPALAASPAGVLATRVGQVVLVVRADRSSEADLRQSVALLDGCDHIQLLLNAVSFPAGGQRFGDYYGQER